MSRPLVGSLCTGPMFGYSTVYMRSISDFRTRGSECTHRKASLPRELHNLLAGHVYIRVEEKELSSAVISASWPHSDHPYAHAHGPIHKESICSSVWAIPIEIRIMRFIRYTLFELTNPQSYCGEDTVIYYFDLKANARSSSFTYSTSTKSASVPIEIIKVYLCSKGYAARDSQTL